MRTYSIEQAATVLQISPRLLSDKRYRARLGLAGRKIGKRLIFAEEDVLRLLERGRESLPGEERRWANFLLARCYVFVYVSLRNALTPDLSMLRFLLRLIASALCWSCFHDCP